MGFWAAVLWATSSACNGRSAREAATPAPPNQVPPESASTEPEAPEPLPLAEQTTAPRPAPAPDPALEEWLALCGRGEEALHEVAQAIAERRAETGELPELEWTLFRMRQRGAPYVRPRVWSTVLPASSSPEEARQRAERVSSWARRPARGALWCGIGEVSHDEHRVIALVQVEARAHMAPIPVRVEAGTWLTLQAELLVPATDASAVLLAPQGRPRPIAVRQDGAALSARFTVDSPGSWTLQILANDEGGALPVLEALVHAGEGPFVEPWLLAVPGEAAQESDMSDGEALLAMLNEGRRLSGISVLEPNPTLEALARHHAELLRERGTITHDAGHGDPQRRIEEAGLVVRRAGENVARASSVLRAYRALWASPSHRGNLLHPHFDEVGIGVARDREGTLYTSLLFIDSR